MNFRRGTATDEEWIAFQRAILEPAGYFVDEPWDGFPGSSGYFYSPTSVLTTIPASITVNFVNDVDLPDVNHPFAATFPLGFTENGAGRFRIDIDKQQLTRTDEWGGDDFFTETVWHELGHVCSAFIDYDAALELFGSGPVDTGAWQNRRAESVAETFKDLFGTRQRYTNRTTHQLPREKHDEFVGLFIPDTIYQHADDIGATWEPMTANSHGTRPSGVTAVGGPEVGIEYVGWFPDFPFPGQVIGDLTEGSDLWRFTGGGLDDPYTGMEGYGAQVDVWVLNGQGGFGSFSFDMNDGHGNPIAGGGGGSWGGPWFHVLDGSREDQIAFGLGGPVGASKFGPGLFGDGPIGYGVIGTGGVGRLHGDPQTNVELRDTIAWGNRVISGIPRPTHWPYGLFPPPPPPPILDELVQAYRRGRGRVRRVPTPFYERLVAADVMNERRPRVNGTTWDLTGNARPQDDQGTYLDAIADFVSVEHDV